MEWQTSESYNANSESCRDEDDPSKIWKETTLKKLNIVLDVFALVIHIRVWTIHYVGGFH
ncbi:hypothetical protein ERO13_A03G166750v2 [Gossypium hirsutum]|nr:hypothetical protein ERO13_A03G166750v2 [Gossypium hirsutum]